MSEEDNRYAEIEQRLIKNEYIYKHYYEQKDKLDVIIKKYKDVTEFDNSSVQSTGRVMVIRNFKKLIFFSLQQENSRIQLIANQDTENFEETLQLRRGDIVGFSGIVGRSRTGELSIFVRKLELLTPCLRTVPTDHFGLKGTELIYRKRYLDLLINMESREAFVMRSKCINFMRNYFNEHNFLEVETPIMDTSYGGAAARPFITYHNELKTNLYLRIAPELYLKKLVVGGLDRVFEVGKQFRNEGIDATHNPEFTSAEFYAAYEDYNSFMDLTENFLSGLFKSLKSEKITYDGKEINFKRPFRRIDLLSELNRCSGLNLDASRLDEQKGVMFEKCKELKLKIKEKTTAKLLDKLVGHYIEPQCVDPTFIINHPVVMSPLAKKHRENEFLTERFELFVNGQEIANAYTELNDPYDQKKRFIEQVQQKEEDDEAMEYDEGFVEALEFGLPPTAGLGFGIDRIVMLLTNSTSIRDVILFPTMK